jgi:hypothetical protein
MARGRPRYDRFVEIDEVRPRVRSPEAPLFAKRSGPTRYLAAIVATVLVVLLCLSDAGSAAAATIKASSGAFQTVIPPGFANKTAAFSGSAIRIELAVAEPPAHGFAVNVAVVRERSATKNVAAVTQAAIAYERAETREYAFSTVQSLRIAGDPARAYDYLTTIDGKNVRQRQVLVIHDGWVYIVTYSALNKSQYQGSLSALGQMLSRWRWL